jgi:hypothetical protein
MTMSPIAITLSLEDSDLRPDALESLTQNVQSQLGEIAEEVRRVPVQGQESIEMVGKGEQKQPGLLNLEINLDKIRAVVTWLYQRIAGKTTKAKLKFGEGSDALEFEFEGSSQKDLTATLQDVTMFVEKIKQIQQSNQV